MQVRGGAGSPYPRFEDEVEGGRSYIPYKLDL